MVGQVLSAGAQVLGAVAQYGNSNYQAAIANNNAVIAGYNAKEAADAGQIAAQTQSMRGADLLGKVKASQAANGVDVNSGSAVDVQVGAREESVFNANTTEHNALLQAYGYRVQQQSDLAQAKLDQAQGTQELVGGILGASGSLISGANATGFSLGGTGSGAGGSSFGDSLASDPIATSMGPTGFAVGGV